MLHKRDFFGAYLLLHNLYAFLITWSTGGVCSGRLTREVLGTGKTRKRWVLDAGQCQKGGVLRNIFIISVMACFSWLLKYSDDIFCSANSSSKFDWEEGLIFASYTNSFPFMSESYSSSIIWQQIRHVKQIFWCILCRTNWQFRFCYLGCCSQLLLIV